MELPDFTDCHIHHIRRITEIFQFTFIDNNHLAAGAGYVFNDMGREDYNAILTQFYQQITETDTFTRVETGCWLIHHQNTGKMKQDEGYTDTLFHTAGERTDLIIFPFIHMDGFQHIFQTFIPLLVIGQSFQDSLVIEEFPGRHILVRTEFLRQETDQALQFLPVDTGIQSVDPYTAVTLLQNTADNTHQRGFTGSVRSQQTEHTRTDLERDTPQRFERLSLFSYQRNTFHHTEPGTAQTGKPSFYTFDIDLPLIQILGRDINCNTERPQKSDNGNQPRIIHLPEQDKQNDGRDTPEDRTVYIFHPLFISETEEQILPYLPPQVKQGCIDGK